MNEDLKDDVTCEVCGYGVYPHGGCEQDGCKNSHFPYGLNPTFSERDARILVLIEEHERAAERGEGHRYRFSVPILYSVKNG